MAAAVRAGRISRAGVSALEGEWDDYWAAVRVVELSTEIAARAGELCRTHGLRGADGVHVASALTLVDANPVFAAWDQRLAAAAAASGLRVAPTALAPAPGLGTWPRPS